MEIEIENFSESVKIQSDFNKIIEIPTDKLTYNDFFRMYMSKNVPIVIKNVEILTPISMQWLEKNGDINIDILSQILHENEVPVYDCSKQYFNSHEKTSMTFKTYADYWKSKREHLIYLKDFHLKQQRPDLDFYIVPEYFVSDWLNEYLTYHQKDDYRFVYLGTKGTWTPFHSDVFGSFSWSINVSGRKRWIFLPPGEENKLRNMHNQLPFSIDENALTDKNVKYFILEQEANDAVFVPSQWYHQVENLTDALSINHNWFNSCNISVIMTNLIKNLEDVKLEISDCCDMENFNDHCQLMLKSLFGMNFADFFDILSFIADKRLEQVKTKLKKPLFEIYLLGNNHAKHDLEVIIKVLKEMMNLHDISVNLRTKIDEIISKINIETD